MRTNKNNPAGRGKPRPERITLEHLHEHLFNIEKQLGCQNRLLDELVKQMSHIDDNAALMQKVKQTTKVLNALAVVPKLTPRS